MSEKLEFLTLEGLSEYKTLNDAEVKQAIDEATKNSIKTVSVSEDGYTVYFYTKDEPVTEREAKYSIKFPSPVNVDAKADKVKNATAGNFAGLDENGNLTDSGKKADDFDKAGAALKVQTDLLKLIGTIPASAVSKDIVNYINEQVDKGKYDDTDIKKLANENKVAIDILNGTGDGSVTKTVAQALTDFVQGAPEDLDTYKELTDWIVSHKSDALTMSNDITKNTRSIEEVKTLIGTLPENVKSKTVIEYIAEYVGDIVGDFNFDDITNEVANLDNRVGTLETDVDTTKNRVTALETKTSQLDSKIGTIPTSSSATNVIDYVTEVLKGIQPDVSSLLTRMNAVESRLTTDEANIQTNTDNISTLQGLVGGGFEAIPIKDIQALFK